MPLSASCLTVRPNVEDRQFLELVARRLGQEPNLVAAWLQYSRDERGTPSPYLEGTEVGFVEVADGQVRTRGVRRFETATETRVQLSSSLFAVHCRRMPESLGTKGETVYPIPVAYAAGGDGNVVDVGS
jgi:hypothetical protein